MRKTHVLTLEQMRVYASPVRQRIVASLMARGFGSIAEVAQDMGRRPDTLYHHFRLLLEKGLLAKSGERIAGKNREALYAPIARRLAADEDTLDPAYLQAFAKLVRSVMLDAANHHAFSYLHPQRRDVTLLETANVRLRPDRALWFKKELAALVEKAKEESCPEGERHLLALISCPVGKT